MAVYKARDDARIVILDSDFRAYRSIRGTWMPKPQGGLLVETLEEDFVEVGDLATADKLRSEASAALSLKTMIPVSFTTEDLEEHRRLSREETLAMIDSLNRGAKEPDDK